MNHPIAFQQYIVSISLDLILPQQELSVETRKSISYRYIAASIKEIGLIEPLVVFPRSATQYLLLDGHTRLDVLKARGDKSARCILTTDDEAYTYNRRVNAIPPIAQHLMLLEALRNGLSEERIARSLQVDVSVIRQKRDMLNGICPEAVGLLRDKKLNANIFTLLRKMKPFRQIQVAEHMIANSSYSVTFVKALLYATRPELLIDKARSPHGSNGSDASRNLLIQESEELLRGLKSLEDSYGKNALALTVCYAYVDKLLENTQVIRYLERKHKQTLDAIRFCRAQKKLQANRTVHRISVA